MKELAPYDPDWYYIRAASMARKVYLRGGLGVGAFRRIYGGSKRNGSRPPHFCKSSGGIARHILQQLETMNIVELDTKGGRRITLMSMLSRDLQFMVREPISPGSTSTQMHSTFKPNQSMDVNWYSDHGTIYIDGCNVHYNVQLGDTIEIASDAPVLHVFLPQDFTQIRSRY